MATGVGYHFTTEWAHLIQAWKEKQWAWWVKQRQVFHSFILSSTLETFSIWRDMINSKTDDWTATWLACIFLIKTSPVESLPQALSLRWPPLFVPRTRPCPLHLPPHRPGLNSVGNPPRCFVLFRTFCVRPDNVRTPFFLLSSPLWSAAVRSAVSSVNCPLSRTGRWDLTVGG